MILYHPTATRPARGRAVQHGYRRSRPARDLARGPALPHSGNAASLRWFAQWQRKDEHVPDGCVWPCGAKLGDVLPAPARVGTVGGCVFWLDEQCRAAFVAGFEEPVVERVRDAAAGEVLADHDF